MTFDGVKDPLALRLINSACPERSCCAATLDFETVLDMVAEAGAIDAAQAQRLLRADSGILARALDEIAAFRDVVRQAIDAFAHAHPVADGVLAQIDAALQSCGITRAIVREGNGYRTVVRFEVNEPRDLLMPIAHSVAELLASADPSRVKHCRQERCSCYFIDTSKNRTRAWCSMQRCGNREKVANYYRRSKQNETAGNTPGRS